LPPPAYPRREMKRIFLFLFAVLIAGDLYAFDYASYELRDLDEVISQAKAYDPEKTTGQSVLMPPQRIHLYEKVARYPFKCESRPIVVMLAMAIKRKEQEMPPMNYCMQIQSKNGEKIAVVVQNSIADYVEKEYDLGQKIHLWSLWLFVNASDKKPYFVINAIGEAEPGSTSGVK
jgi:hypothetical protein